MLTRPRGIMITAFLLLITALVISLFWVTFFADTQAQADSAFARQCPAWYAWERSFPVADAWMALACFIGALGLLRMRSWGLLFSALGASALIFLGLIDVTFFVQNGLYTPFNLDVAIEAVIHAWAVGVGGFVVGYIWKQRHLLVDKSNRLGGSIT